MTGIPPLVETAWLADHLERDDLCVLDCSWYLPSAGRDAVKEFNCSHIPGASFFDIDDICDSANPLPHMLPDETGFSRKVTELGITNNTHVICYDVPGLFSAARVWWMFLVFGHDKVSILNGGFKKWVAEGLPETNINRPVKSSKQFKAIKNENMLVTYKKILEHVEAKDVNILDARPEGRFRARDPEPRPELPSGHMPGSICMPFSLLLQPNGCLKPVDDMSKIFIEAGFNPKKPIITTCGSGVTAAILTFALYLMGHKQSRLYDGAWSEYASIATSPILSD